MILCRMAVEMVRWLTTNQGIRGIRGYIEDVQSGRLRLEENLPWQSNHRAWVFVVASSRGCDLSDLHYYHHPRAAPLSTISPT